MSAVLVTQIDYPHPTDAKGLNELGSVNCLITCLDIYENLTRNLEKPCDPYANTGKCSWNPLQTTEELYILPHFNILKSSSGHH